MKKSLIETLGKAAKLLEQFEFEDSERQYRKVLKKHPENAAALMGMALILNRTGQSVPALEMLKKIWLAIENSPPEKRDSVHPSTKGEILAQMGLALQILGIPDKALALYSEANRLFPTAQMQQRINNLSDSELADPLQRALDKAHRARASNNIAQAIEEYKAALALHQDNDRALYGLGDIYRERGEFQVAMPLIQQAIIMQPMVAEYQNALGMLFQQRGDHQKASLFYRRALDIDPNYSAAQCNLGVAYKNLQRLDEAAAAYRKAIAINPAMAEAYNNLGNLLRLMGDLDGAQASLEKALEIRPGYQDARKNLDALILNMKELKNNQKAEKKADKQSGAIAGKKGDNFNPATTKAAKPAKPKPGTAAASKPAKKSRVKPSSTKTVVSKTKPGIKQTATKAAVVQKAEPKNVVVPKKQAATQANAADRPEASPATGKAAPKSSPANKPKTGSSAKPGAATRPAAKPAKTTIKTTAKTKPQPAATARAKAKPARTSTSKTKAVKVAAPKPKAKSKASPSTKPKQPKTAVRKPR